VLHDSIPRCACPAGTASAGISNEEFYAERPGEVGFYSVDRRRRLLVYTWFSPKIRHGASGVARLVRIRCRRCGKPTYHRSGPDLFTRPYRGARRLTEGGLGEAHAQLRSRVRAGTLP
jgi:hypothetical protein